MSSTIPLVLIVEDEALVREIAAAAIEDAGFEVIEAANAQEAVDLLNGRPDVEVLFTDVDMPGKLDGLALANLVHAQWPAIRLVVTSGRSLAGPVPDDGRFVAKPYSLQHLADTLTSVTGNENDCASAAGSSPTRHARGPAGRGRSDD